MSAERSHRCPGVTRRSFLADTGLGFTGLALGALLFKDGVARAAERPDGHWIFLCGGVSHVESFDPKPELNKYAGKSIEDTPYKDVLNPERLKNVVSPNPEHGGRKVLMALNSGCKKYGQSGLAVGEWWQNVGGCADDLAVVRSLYTTDNDHGAQLQWHTGRHVREGPFPTIGSWVAYGLGSLNQNLPEYFVLGEPTGDCCGGEWTHGAGYLGPSTPASGSTPAAGAAAVRPPAAGEDRRGARGRVQPAGQAQPPVRHRLPRRPGASARIKSYELAFGMQTAVPETLEMDKEPVDADAVWPGSGRDAAVRRAVPGGASAGRARRAVRPDLPRRRRRRRLGRPRRHQGQPLPALGPGGSADRRPAEGPEAARDARRDHGGLGHRVRPVARRPGRRPRPSSVGLLRLAGRRRHQGRRRPRRHRRARLPRRRESPLRHRHPCHGAAPARARPERLEVPGRKRLEIDRGKVISEILV